MKEEKISKVILARDFMISVDDESLKLSDLSQDTKDKVEVLLAKIISTLEVAPVIVATPLEIK